MVPARAFSLFFARILFLTFVLCCLNVSSGSNVTPRIFRFLQGGTQMLLINMFNSGVTSLVQKVDVAEVHAYVWDAMP